MSVITGKCDLLDHLFMCGQIKEDQDNKGPIRCDLLKGFEKFKKETNGVIYKSQKIHVNERNQNLVKKYCDQFEIIEHREEIIDKRYKDNKKEVITYTYRYYFTDYNNLKELNKHGVYITLPITFDRIADLIPYFSYTIAAGSFSKDHAHVVLSKESYIDRLSKEFLENGTDPEFLWKQSRKNQSNIMIKTILDRYGHAISDTITDEFKIVKEGDKYLIHLQEPIDNEFPIKVFNPDKKVIISTPTILDDYTLDCTKCFIKDAWEYVVLKYVKKNPYLREDLD